MNESFVLHLKLVIFTDNNRRLQKKLKKIVLDRRSCRSKCNDYTPQIVNEETPKLLLFRDFN